MKTFIIIWLVIVCVLLIVGWVWYYLDKKNEKRNKTPMIVFVVEIILLTLQVRSEEKRLEADFGDEYRDYKLSVPRYFIK